MPDVRTFGKKRSKFIDSKIGKKYINNRILVEYCTETLEVGSEVTLKTYEATGILPLIWVKYSRYCIEFESKKGETYFYEYTNKERFKKDFTLIKKEC